jgi:mannose-6-phosphate isomerase-like protein (cupin superfamily)
VSANDKINLAEKFALLDEAYHPATIGHFNDAKLVVAFLDGEFVWHSHDDTDDFFLVMDGELTIQLRDRDVVLGPGELFVVPRGVEHCPKADVPTRVLLIEKAGTPNTGDAGGELTRAERDL